MFIITYDSYEVTALKLAVKASLTTNFGKAFYEVIMAVALHWWAVCEGLRGFLQGLGVDPQTIGRTRAVAKLWCGGVTF